MRFIIAPDKYRTDKYDAKQPGHPTFLNADQGKP